jgi:regulator of protease activity HflC (stomatin/prohibitin superfamily)
MTFPYPERPEDWQTAYTRDDAYRDSEKRRSEYLLRIIICFFILLTYVYFRLANSNLFTGSTPLIKASFILITTLMSIALFIVIVKTASNSASTFFAEFYHPPEKVDPAKIIKYRLLGRSKLPPPLNLFSQFEYILIKDGQIDKKEKWSAWSACNLGGPISLIVFDGNALYLERGNRFSRVVGPGDNIPFLEWYETIKYVVDLRPKIKTDKFDAWTKDGIKISLEVQIECRIGDPSKNDPANGIVYPYDPIAVKKAVERYSVRWPDRLKGEQSEFTWIDAAWGQVTGIVPGYISSRMLDDLFIANRNSGQILSPHAMKEILGKLNNATNMFGVFITDFQIQKIELPKGVEDHQKDYWKAERQGIAAVIDGQAKAFSIRAHEQARADGQYDLILAIAEGLEKYVNGHFTEPMLLSLSSVLDESIKEPLTRAYLAKETLDTLEQLKKMVEETTTRLDVDNESGRNSITE